MTVSTAYRLRCPAKAHSNVLHIRLPVSQLRKVVKRCTAIYMVANSALLERVACV